jgi:hypothetical protein
MGQNSLSLPGVVTSEGAPSVPGFNGIRPQDGLLIGKFADGDELTPTLVGPEDINTDWGGLVVGSAAYDAAQFFARGPRRLYVIRVKGTAASVTVVDQATPTPASKMKIEAKVDGTWATYSGTGGPGSTAIGIRCVVAAGTLTETFKLTVNAYLPHGTTNRLITEVYDNLSLESAATRYFGTYVTAMSKIVTVTDLAPNAHAAANLPATGNADLTGGAEPTYSTGIAEHEKIRGRLAMFMDVGDSTSNTALIAAVNARSLSDGVGTISADASIAILNPPAGTTHANLLVYGNAQVEPRVKLMGDYKLALDPVANASGYVRPAGIYAGIRCATVPWFSVLNQFVSDITGSELALTRAQMEAELQAGIQLIQLWPDDESRGMRLLSDIQSDGSQTFVRLVKDYEAAIGLANLAGFVGKHQGIDDPDPVRTSVVALFTAFYEDRAEVERYLVKCDSDNNTETSIALKELHVRREVKYREVIETIADELVAGTGSVIARG